ncbi:peptidyl-prolyl cis-trans isomerase NIMA-interacting 1 [Nannochloropsis gaditana CCMP526]|uniref:peptidyl-prolyl cis-trans isomerase NIMA-interacting 1 n=1 Tax=Nannochloropsis gaditana (strain CCMP526) TaxID=1093141 RepID=UPI00029F6051|nr:peptidyl-prolyl cis-trans isomerase NIMA-interacting 1 [Nannochloropsis gaditana CCMP526]EKU21511.1 peptidyl-prolyl cis-trans isomerase NIMA-interacting 1 [Nannochloropsis gaditana CCMP526]|eukprot:XP_005854844.1 peptidyl-prolyl cis-trans isomerase NIMA-interacting 1 [Nannochloropsis gaditana CCMP526]
MSDIPAGWVQRESRSRGGQIYYYNTTTGESVWEKPTAPASAESGQVHVLHLLKKHKGSRRPSSWRQENITCTKEEAMQSLAAHNTLAPSPSPTALREQIVSAGSASMQRAFEDLAKVESDCSSARAGGSLGFFGRGQMQKPFEGVGELSDLISTDSGVHIIYRVA